MNPSHAPEALIDIKDDEKPGASVRVVCPNVVTGQPEIAALTENLNLEIAQIVDTVKRWWDGGYGERVGEDSSKSQQFQDFTSIALEEIAAKHLVRVLTHLMEGTCWHSAAGSIRYSDTAAVAKAIEKGYPPPQGVKAYEKAVRGNDLMRTAQLDNYLRVVSAARTGESLPLKYLVEKKAQLKEWFDFVLDEACQHLKSHIKLLKDWEKNEANRLKDLKKFEDSALGKAYLTARERFFPDGISRSRSERIRIFSQAELIRWHKKTANLTPAEGFAELFEKNPELVKLRNTHTEYERLKKPISKPSWQPVSPAHPRWPFIPKKCFVSQLQWKYEKTLVAGTDERQRKGAFWVSLKVPDFGQPGAFKVIDVSLTETGRLTRATKTKEPHTFEIEDSITGDVSTIAIKGVRFDSVNSEWRARVTFEKPPPQFTEHEKEIVNVAKKRANVHLCHGDVVCVFTVDPRSARTGDGKNRAGWLQIYGNRNDLIENLASMPLDSSQNHDAKRHFSRGVNHGRASAHGATRGVTYPQLLKEKATLDALVRYIRILRDPERREDALERVTKRLNNQDKGGRVSIEAHRLRRIQTYLETSAYESLAPLLNRERQLIKTMRSNIQGMKRALRNGIAINVLTAVHSVRVGNSTSNSTNKLRANAPTGRVFLVIEEHKGRGAGPLRTSGMNWRLSTLGAAEICKLIEEKAAFMSPAIPVIPVVPAGIKKDCPKCEHTHAKGQSGPTFCCAACNHREFISSAAARNLFKLFLNGKKPTATPEEAVDGEEIISAG